MKNGKKPDPKVIHPITGYDKEIFVKPTVMNEWFTVEEIDAQTFAISEYQHWEFRCQRVELVIWMFLW